MGVEDNSRGGTGPKSELTRLRLRLRLRQCGSFKDHIAPQSYYQRIMDCVPASDEEDISFPAPVAAPKSNPLEDPYSFEALVGTSTRLIVFTLIATLA